VKRAAALILGALALVPTLTGCPGAHPRPTEIIRSADELIAAAAAPAAKVVELLGDIKVDSLDRKGGFKGRVKADASFVLSRPDKLRIDVYDLGGVSLVTAVTKPAGFALYDMGKKTYYYGPPTSCSMEVLLGLPFAPAELLRVILGNPPILEGGARSVRYNGKTGEYELKVVRGDETQLCLFEATGPRLRECSLSRDGKVVDRLSYEGWFEVPGLPGATVPGRLYYERPTDSADVLIKIKKVWLPVGPLEPDTFDLTAPTGVDVVGVCDTAESTFVPGG
jgi:hypothetical protein